MKLYNTLTRIVENIQPLNPPSVTVYTCGPTVYDYAHIGHWFTYVRTDLLIRVLKASGLQPKWVMNVTDVGHLVSDADEGEDKLEKGARREGKTAWEVAQFYEQDFFDGAKQLGILRPDHIVRATEHIPEQIALIQKLEEKGYTYVIDDGVYYDTSKFEGYAAFARLDLDDQQAGARVALNPQKRNPTDFALWKFSPKDRQRDMEWESPWGIGFPGWHIECSAMSMKYLGDTLDIHTGGIDHVPVHHTNEIAQSEAATGKRFAQYWMHSNHVMVNGEKISKSLGNGIRLADIFKMGISPDVIRLHILQSHYRSQSKFSFDGLSSAQHTLNRVRNNFSWAYNKDVSANNQQRDILRKQLTSLKNKILGHLRDDLNTPEALAVLYEASGLFALKQLDQIDIKLLDDFVAFIQESLGLSIIYRHEVAPEEQKLLNDRVTARESKDWESSDRIRSELASKGIVVIDDPMRGQIWYKG